MMIHLGIQDALGERLFQAVEKAVWIKGRLDQRPSWDRPQPKAGPGWHPEYEALCVWAWVGSFVPFMPDPHTKFLMLPGRSISLTSTIAQVWGVIAGRAVIHALAWCPAPRP